MNAMRNLPLLNLIVILIVISSIFLFDTTSGARKARRCFNCRSRGELGDCRDPFYLSANSTLVKNSKKGMKMNIYGILNMPYEIVMQLDIYITLLLITGSLFLLAGVKMLPCSSGWCKKFVGGNQDKLKSDQAIEHERGCLTRGPPDNKPRCFEHDFGMMCICKGDLCNEATTVNMSYGKLLSSLIIGWLTVKFIKNI